MERGGFHSYQKLTNTTSGMKVAELHARVAEADINHNNGCSNHHLDDNECSVREQDRFMPIANVIRIMRKILPPHAKISDDAKETIQECVSEFISFITSEANDRCQREQRKTITAEDVLYAMSKLGFDDYIEPLTVYLQRYRELEGERSSMRGVPYLKRNVELGIAAFAPAFAMTGGHQNGFFGVAMGAYSTRETTTNTTSSSSQAAAALANGEQAFAHQNMRG